MTKKTILLFVAVILIVFVIIILIAVGAPKKMGNTAPENRKTLSSDKDNPDDPDGSDGSEGGGTSADKKESGGKENSESDSPKKDNDDGEKHEDKESEGSSDKESKDEEEEDLTPHAPISEEKELPTEKYVEPVTENFEPVENYTFSDSEYAEIMRLKKQPFDAQMVTVIEDPLNVNEPDEHIIGPEMMPEEFRDVEGNMGELLEIPLDDLDDEEEEDPDNQQEEQSDDPQEEETDTTTSTSTTTTTTTTTD